MKKLRVNMCFNEVDNSEVIRLIEQSRIKRPSGIIHDLVRKGILFEKLVSGQLFNSLSVIQSEVRGNNAPHSEKHHTELEPTDSQRRQEIPLTTPEIKKCKTEEISQNQQIDNLSDSTTYCLADLGSNFD